MSESILARVATINPATGRLWDEYVPESQAELAAQVETNAAAVADAVTTVAVSTDAAAASASAAAGSATDAANSASAAATSETNANSFATNAATSASSAATSASNSAGSATAAASSATSAGTAASSASTQAVQAATSASQAAGSATAAASAATTAITTGLAAGGSIKAADDATLSAAKSYADSGVAQVNTWFLRGNGSPVGVVKPSSAGVQYVDLSATNGARIWISTGTTESAWRVVDGDTGRRTMQSLILNGWSATLILRRINSLVILEVANLTSTAATSNIILAYAPGFAIPRFSIFPIAVQGGTRRVITKTVTDSLLERYGSDPYSDAGGLTDVLHWGTTQQWPTTLPGTPA